MFGAILIGGVLGLAGWMGDEQPLLAIGRYAVSATFDRSTTREGTLVVTEASPSLAVGYIDWRGVGERGRMIEQFVALPGEDSRTVEVRGFRTETLGKGSTPSQYTVQRGAQARDVRGGIRSELNSPQVATPWSVSWVGERLPESAGQFDPKLNELGDRELSLRSLSRWCRCQGVERFEEPCAPILARLGASQDPLARAIAARKIELTRIQMRFAELSDFTPLAQQMQQEFQGLLLEGMLSALTGQEVSADEVGRAIGSKNGSLDNTSRRKIDIAKVAIEGLAAEHALRDVVRSNFAPDTTKVERLDSTAFEVRVIGDGDDVLLSITNRSGRVLDNVVICSEFGKDEAAVTQDIVARNTAELPFQFLLPALGFDSDVAARGQLGVDAVMALYAAPVGSLSYRESWQPDVEVVVPAVGHVGEFVRYVDSATLWIGADGTQFNAKLDVDEMRSDVRKWHAAGRPRPSWKAAAKFRAEGGEQPTQPSAGAEEEFDPLTVARRIAAKHQPQVVFSTNSEQLNTHPDVVFLLEVMMELERLLSPNVESRPSANAEVWREFLTLSNLSRRDPETFTTMVRAGSSAIRGLQTALMGTGCGRPIVAMDVQPGDFVQYWWKSAKDRTWKLENMKVGIVSRVETKNGARLIRIFGVHRLLLAEESGLKEADRKGGIGDSVAIRMDDPETCVAFFARWTRRPSDEK